MKSIAMALAATVALGACAESKHNIQPAATERVTHTMQAAGVQVYQCKTVRDNPTKHEWSFVGPEADLYDGSGQRVGRHYGGPTWEALDGSKVVAHVSGRMPAKSAERLRAHAREVRGFDSVAAALRAPRRARRHLRQCDEHPACRNHRRLRAVAGLRDAERW
jgi:hypothetical protein